MTAKEAALLVPLTLLEPGLLVIFHQSLTQVVQVVDISMALVLASLVALYAAEHRDMNLAPEPMSARSVPGTASIGVNR